MERKLINYLPYAVRDFSEYQGITTGEQPEFELAWDSHEEVFVNQFIDTALDYGLSRWEKMLNIFPKGTDTLETRRARIKTKLNNFTPYTFRVFMRMLTAISNGDPFSVFLEPGSYLLKIETQWGASGQIESLEYLIKNIVPCNIALNVMNRLTCIAEGVARIAGGVCAINMFFITNDGVEQKTICGIAKIGAGTIGAETFFITNDSRKQMEGTGAMFTRGGVVHAVCPVISPDRQDSMETAGSVFPRGSVVHVDWPVITNDRKEKFAADGAVTTKGGVTGSAVVVLTNDFNEAFRINGNGLTNGGTVMTEIIEIESENERKEE